MAHPYYPRSLELPGYVANTLPLAWILVPFFGAVLVIGLVAWSLTGGSRDVSGKTSTRRRTLAAVSGYQLTTGERWTVVWFSVCAAIHTLFEAYYVAMNARIGGDLSFFGQTWKEYALADSRYLTADSTVLGIEGLTAVLKGPLSALAVYGVVTRKPWRYVLQLLVSFGQLYGCTLYYITAALDGFKDSHPAPYYFYGYFVLMNLPWIIVPVLIMVQSVRVLNEAVALRSRKTK